MRLTQGAFSFLPELTDDEIRVQLEYCLAKNWAVAIEHTDSPHPRNTYWEMWGLPMFDRKDTDGILGEIRECRKSRPGHYVRVNALDATRGLESVALSFIVQRPAHEPSFKLVRQEGPGRNIRYSVVSDAGDRPPEGESRGPSA